MLPYRWMKFFEQEDVPPQRCLTSTIKRKAPRYAKICSICEEEGRGNPILSSGSSISKI